MTQIKNKLQDLELKNLKEQVESLCSKVSNLQYDFHQFMENHWATFKETNATEHGEFRNSQKWVYLLFSSLVIPLILSLIK